MAREANRYDIDPKYIKGQRDIVSYITEIDKNLRVQATALQAGHTAIEDGDFTIRNGDIIVSESTGDIVLRILHGAVPEIRMWPLGESDTHRIAIVGINDPVGGGQAALFVVEKTDATQDGGKVLITRNYAILSHQPDGGQETYMWLNPDPVTSEIILFRGRWPNQSQYDTRQAIYPGTFVASSGFSTWTHSYLSSFATTMVSVCTVLHSGSTIEWVLDSQSTSQFTVRFNSTANAKTINFWNFRL